MLNLQSKSIWRFETILLIRCRGQTTIQIQNRTQYLRKHRHQGATPQFSKTVWLPDRLYDLARINFNDSELYRKALESAENLDESEMPQLDLDPPYPPPSYQTDTPNEMAYTLKMVDVMNGRRERLERLCDHERVVSCTSKQELRMRLEHDLETAFKDWKRLDKIMETCDSDGDPRALTMSRHLLQWRARTVLNLYNTIMNHN
jgi:hypothetical protein